MYHSRYHFERDNIHLAIDSMTGEILELFSCDTGDNLIKNSLFDMAGTFTLVWRDGKGEHMLSAPHSRAALENPALRCTVASEETEVGLCVRVQYDRLTDGETTVPLALTYSALLHDSEIQWSVMVCPAESGTLTEVRFPVLNGVWLGESYRDNTLYYPFRGGMRIEDPVGYLYSKPVISQWRWQEYRYRYYLHGVEERDTLKQIGLRGMSDIYPGYAGMSYMCLDGQKESLYYACHDPLSKPCRPEAGSLGENAPGLCLATAFYPYTKENEAWHSPQVITWLHRGDWHAGARRYHDFRTPLLPKKKQSPAWLSHSAGLVAHYDFKYQNGGIVHRYADIPALAEQAKEMGFCHMLFAGWHKDGFDCGFPEYVFDEALGTEDELREGIKKAKSMGVHVTFYLNARIHNRAYRPERVDTMGIMREDGTVAAEVYGNPNIAFSTMCPGSRSWQDLLCESIRRATEDYGADGVYLDQLSCRPYFCFNPDHHHVFDDWSEHYNTILLRIADRYWQTHGEPLYISGEWLTDTHGSLVDLGLFQTFFKYHTGAFPEMYRYTFPEHGIADMLYPSRNLAMRPTHISQVSEQLMARLFCNGSYFWVYDLEEDNTFRRDPVGYARLQTLCALSTMRRTLLPNAVYRERDGIACTDGAVCLSRFADTEADLLCLYTYSSGDDVSIRLSNTYRKAVKYTADGGETVCSLSNGMLTIPRTTSLILLKK
ncbi:MAG: hypothetical protein E7664_00305 [Ruminococcaceae bacterium]|nr:hypothetical protein [Oscillospiraceae bacterium]